MKDKSWYEQAQELHVKQLHERINKEMNDYTDFVLEKMENIVREQQGLPPTESWKKKMDIIDKNMRAKFKLAGEYVSDDNIEHRGFQWSGKSEDVKDNRPWRTLHGDVIMDNDKNPLYCLTCTYFFGMQYKENIKLSEYTKDYRIPVCPKCGSVNVRDLIAMQQENEDPKTKYWKQRYVLCDKMFQRFVDWVWDSKKANTNKELDSSKKYTEAMLEYNTFVKNNPEP